MAWIKAGTTTLGSAGDDLDITSMTANKFNQILLHEIATGGTVSGSQISFNNVGGTNYSFRASYFGGADSTAVNQPSINHAWNAANEDRFIVIYCSDITGEEKLTTGFWLSRNTAGAGNAPHRSEVVGKYAQTGSRITRIDDNNAGTGDFDTNSNVTALGSDGTEELNVQDGAIYYSSDENKEFVLYNNTWSEV